MGDSVDPKKLLLPYLQRADELQKHEALVAYYCRLYAMERGLKIPSKERGKTVNTLLVSLMNQLEKDKKVVKLNPDDNMYLEGFATRVFAKADKQDRAGKADLNTAKTFYAASLFFEVLHQFGEIPPDIEQRQKYAVWKAADIRKALSEGRKPTPGPPGGDEDFSEVDGMPWDNEGSSQKVDPTTNLSGSPPDDKSHPEENLPPPGMGGQPSPQSNDTLPRVSSFDSMPKPHSNAPTTRGFHHARQSSSDELDLPAAPTQPVHPGGQRSSSPPPQYPPNFPSPYAPTHFSSNDSGEDTGAPPPPPPVIHDWSGGGQPQQSDAPPYSSSAFTYPSAPHDEYGGNSNYSHMPSQSSFVSPSSDQGFNNYSQYPGSGGYPQAGNTYPPPQNYGYVEPAHHQQTTSPPPVPQGSGFSNGTSYPSDVNYQPPPDKVAEAHKAARFAVSSLAFDDVPTALEYLRKSLELLTVPSRTTT